ncbi:hypothetical protein IV80_GL000518 [Pediococcus cellicola]|uniref:Major facilitator superfamily (MFS) profile domain-containing protein n=2 Tax=Pediococcus cellicola TaxID=319652 RepID=A0A0R2IJ21_9LACO|nr:hypothetical protein IV80_GL000518 [Pediococcus cellicola]
MIAPNIAAAIPLMDKTFKFQSASAVETLSTIPNLGIIIGIFLSNVIILKIGQKKTVLVGLVVALFSGLAPVISSNYMIVLCSRLLLGLGIGVFNSLAISMLYDFYKDEELATMLGFQNAAGSLGSSILSFAVSYLLRFGWHATFLIYIICLPVLILFWIIVPDVGEQKKVSRKMSSAKIHTHQRLNFPVILISIITFFLYAFFLVITVKLADLFTVEKIGSPSMASTVLGVFTLVSLLTGLLYGVIYKYLGHKSLPFGLLLMSIGFFMIGSLKAFIPIVFGVIIAGVGFSMTVPTLYTLLGEVAPENSKNLATSTILILTNIGVFMSPILINFFTKFTGNDSPASNMLVCSIGLIVLCLVTSLELIYQQKVNNKEAINKL